MEQDFNFKQVPKQWAICYVAECPRKDECMRYQVCLRAPQGRVYHKCILPTVLAQGECPQFHPIEKVRAAVGFRNIFNHVLAKDVAEMRAEIAAYLGSRATFFRYQRGDILLMPWQQQWIQKLFHRYGYTDEICFDGYKEVYLF